MGIGLSDAVKATPLILWGCFAGLWVKAKFLRIRYQCEIKLETDTVGLEYSQHTTSNKNYSDMRKSVQRMVCDTSEV